MAIRTSGPDLPELLFVTDRDLKIGGNSGQPTNIERQILVREQLDISGNPSLAGQILERASLRGRLASISSPTRS